MFETCSSLEELNRERQRLIRSGAEPMKVNAAYNRSKKRMLDEAPSYRKIPTYTGVARSDGVYTPFPFIAGRCQQNEIIITEEGVLL